MQRFEYATLEWIWQVGQVRVNLPGGEERIAAGMYAELVQTLNQLGREGWQAISCAAAGNWLFWTLQRPTI